MCYLTFIFKYFVICSLIQIERTIKTISLYIIIIIIIIMFKFGCFIIIMWPKRMKES